MSQINRRLGTPPSLRGSVSGQNCPDIFELTDGNFAVIGTDATETLEALLPADATRGEDGRIVLLTRETLIYAKADIPLITPSLDTQRLLPGAAPSGVAETRPAPEPAYREGRQQVKIERRLGVPPQKRGSLTGQTCPDIFELSDGSFAVIGTEATETLDQELPADAARADYERIVVISRETLVRAKADIPDL